MYPMQIVSIFFAYDGPQVLQNVIHQLALELHGSYSSNGIILPYS